MKLAIIREIFKAEVKKVCDSEKVPSDDGALEAFLEYLSDEVDLFELEKSIKQALVDLKVNIHQNNL